MDIVYHFFCDGCVAECSANIVYRCFSVIDVHPNVPLLVFITVFVHVCAAQCSVIIVCRCILVLVLLSNVLSPHAVMEIVFNHYQRPSTIRWSTCGFHHTNACNTLCSGVPF